MPRYSNPKKKSSRKFIAVLVVALGLVALFLASYWITSMILDANQKPTIYSGGKYEDASPTPKPTYEQLEEMVKEKDEEIERLEKELENLRNKSPQATIAPSAPITTPPKTTQPPAATTAPTSAPTATAAPTPAPTAAPTPAPTAIPAA